MSGETLKVVQKIDKSVLFPSPILKIEQQFIKKPFEEGIYKSVSNKVDSTSVDTPKRG